MQRERRDREGKINNGERLKYQFCKKNYSRRRVFFNLSPWAGKTDGSSMVWNNEMNQVYSRGTWPPFRDARALDTLDTFFAHRAKAVCSQGNNSLKKNQAASEKAFWGCWCFSDETLKAFMLLHPVRRCYEDSEWTDEDSDCDRRSSGTTQCGILQPERFRVTAALTVQRQSSFIYSYDYSPCGTTFVASEGISALWLRLSAWLSVVPGVPQCSFSSNLPLRVPGRVLLLCSTAFQWQ